MKGKQIANIATLIAPNYTGTDKELAELSIKIWESLQPDSDYINAKKTRSGFTVSGLKVSERGRRIIGWIELGSGRTYPAWWHIKTGKNENSKLDLVL